MEKKLISIFSTNKINNELINQISEQLGISKELINDEIYEILSAFLNGGKFIEENKPLDWFNTEQLKIGKEVEKEHLIHDNKYTNILARRIALDHLTEIEDYYTRLIKMEEEAKIKK